MQRKWTVLSATMTLVALGATGLTLAQEKSKLEGLMEKVQAKNVLITKSVRTPATYKKAQKDVLASAQELVKIGKEAREEKGPSERQKKKFEDWTKLMDDFIKKAEDLEAVAASSTGTQVQAKNAHTALKNACANCHKDFKVDEP
jgi:cytochrome c556